MPLPFSFAWKEDREEGSRGREGRKQEEEGRGRHGRNNKEGSTKTKEVAMIEASYEGTKEPIGTTLMCSYCKGVLAHFDKARSSWVAPYIEGATYCDCLDGEGLDFLYKV